MGITAAELEERMDVDEMLEHMADYNIIDNEPKREDVRTAAIIEAIVQSNGGKVTRKKIFDGLQMRRELPPAQTEDQMKAALRMLG